MSSGPPPSAAESSKRAEKPPEMLPGTGNSRTSVSRPYQSQNPYASLATAQQSYQNYWQNAWPVYTGSASAVPPAPHYSQPVYAPYQTSHQYPMSMQQAAAVRTSSYSAHNPSASAPSHAISTTMKMENDERANIPSAPPAPILLNYEHWDEALRTFLQDAGMMQALKGFECDMMVMNAEWERTKVPSALAKLIQGLGSTREFQSSPKGKGRAEDQGFTEPEVDRSLEERKLDYVHLKNGEKARTSSSINKEISAFLARNRARNDASNRSEFLLSLSEKRKRLQDSGDAAEDGAIPSCARTDARTIDRDAQMKYDIAKNDDGPLRRTKAKKSNSQQSTTQQSSTRRSEDPIIVPSDEEALPKHHPGVDERLSNIETHLAVRYVPSPPRTLWARLKFVEDHIVRLEKDYPPWAALHFNQPNRGWPPPPRATPIIVPPHLRSSGSDKTSTTGAQSGSQASPSVPLMIPVGGPKPRNTKSSLQRAVMERLEVKQAMGESADFGG